MPAAPTSIHFSDLPETLKAEWNREMYAGMLKFAPVTITDLRFTRWARFKSFFVMRWRNFWWRVRGRHKGYWKATPRVFLKPGTPDDLTAFLYRRKQ